MIFILIINIRGQKPLYNLNWITQDFIYFIKVDNLDKTCKLYQIKLQL